MSKEKQAPLGKSVKVGIPSQNLIKDPRAKSSIRGSNARIATGDQVTVKGTKALRKDKKPVKATWY